MNPDKNPVKSSRRNVLKTIGTGAVVGSAVISGASGSTLAANYSAFSNQDVFVERGASVELPKSATKVNSLEKADVGVAKTDTNVARSRIVDFIKQGKTISFAGRGSEEALHAILSDQQPSQIAETAGTSEYSHAPDLDEYSFGAEYNEHLGSSSSTIVPLNNGSLALSVQRNSTTSKKITADISRTLTQFGVGGGMSIQDEYPTDTSCVNFNDSWNCKGVYNDSGSYKPHGRYSITVKCSKSDETSDTNNDYYVFQIDQDSTPGIAVNDWSSNYQNRELYRRTDFYQNNGVELQKIGPNSTVGSTQSTASVGVGFSETGPSVSGSYSYSYSASEVRIENSSDKTEELAEHWHTFTETNTSVSDGYYPAQPAYRIQTGENKSQIGYDLNEYWRWWNPSTLDTYTVNGTGKGYWSV